MPRKRVGVDEEVEDELAVKELAAAAEELDAALGPLIAPVAPRAPVAARATFDDGLSGGLPSAGGRAPSGGSGSGPSSVGSAEAAVAELQDFADTRKAIMSHLECVASAASRVDVRRAPRSPPPPPSPPPRPQHPAPVRRLRPGPRCQGKLRPICQRGLLARRPRRCERHRQPDAARGGAACGLLPLLCARRVWRAEA